jgi:histone H3/H4
MSTVFKNKTAPSKKQYSGFLHHNLPETTDQHSRMGKKTEKKESKNDVKKTKVTRPDVPRNIAHRMKSRMCVGRLSKGAADAFMAFVVSMGVDLGKTAACLSYASKSKTVNREDVRRAAAIRFELKAV